MIDKTQLRDYFLGKLPQAERERLELRAFEEDSFEDLMQEAEYDLLDQWARGGLSKGEKSIVERRFSAEKLSLALALANRQKKPRWLSQPALLWAGIAAGLAVLLGLSAVWHFAGADRRSQPITQVQPVEIAELLLQIPVSRGNIPPAFRIPARAQQIRISAAVDPGYETYEVSVEARSRGLLSQNQAPVANGLVQVVLPSEILSDGVYEISVHGLRGAQPTLLAAYSCSIQRY